jgi:hypothetical protein
MPEVPSPPADTRASGMAYARVIRMRRKAIYRSLDALAPIEKVLAEAAASLGDAKRTIEASSIPEVLGAALGSGVGGGIGFAALYFSGTVGVSAAGITSGLAGAGALVAGGMAAGVFVLAAPVAVLGVAGYAVVSQRNSRKLDQQKDRLLQTALQRRDAILARLKDDAAANAERVDYLTALNAVLQGIIRDLRHDLGQGPVPDAP